MKVDFSPRFDDTLGIKIQDDPFIWKLKKRLQQDMNSMIASTGYPRRGKSESQTTIMENISLNHAFRAKEVTFIPQDYMGRLMQAEAGDSVQFDEPGAEYSNRNFMSIVNKMLNATHITFGSKLITVGWAVPSLKMQDVTTMRLLTYFFTMDAEGQRGRSRFYKTWIDPYSGKFGREQLGRVWFGPAWINRPDERKEYLEMKRQYQDSSYEKYYKEFAKSDDDNADKVEIAKSNIQHALEVLSTNPLPYMNNRGSIDREQIRREFSLSYGDARYVANVFGKKMKSKEKEMGTTNQLVHIYYPFGVFQTKLC